MMRVVKISISNIVPSAFYRAILKWWRKRKIVPRKKLYSVNPTSRVFGLDRGLPIDRYYIELFLKKNSSDIKGRVLEIGDSNYTNRYGGVKVTQSEVLHPVEGNPNATIVGCLAKGDSIPKNAFNCIMLTQTLLYIYDFKSAVINSYRSLKSGGVLLATFPGISQISRYDMDRWGDFWRFTDASARQLFENVFGRDNVKVETYGNVLTACAFLHGLATEELKKEELDFQDEDYQVLISVRAVKGKKKINIPL